MKTLSVATTLDHRPTTTWAAPVLARTVLATTVLATIGLAAAGWVVSVPRMRGMDMGVATGLGSFPFFLSVWVPMMAAMMVPGTLPATLRLAQAGNSGLDLSRYVVSYLFVWALVGVPVFVLYRPHGTTAAGFLLLAAGGYELSPVKRRFRKMCADRSSGSALGVCCFGSTIGLMLMMLALGAMSLTWMALTAGLVLVQKLLQPRAAVDAFVGLAIVALGIAVLAAPASVPGLVQPM